MEVGTRAEARNDLIDPAGGSGGLLSDGASVAPQRKSFYWTTVEIAVLKDVCLSPTRWEMVSKRLPGRSETAAYQKTIELGLKCSWVRQKRVRSEELDARLKEVLGSNGSTGGIKLVAEEFGLPPWFVSRRAGELGLQKPRLKEPDWNADELAIVDGYGADGPGAVHRQLKLAGFERTVGSVCSILKRRKIERLSESSMSGRGVAELMGVDRETVVRWIEHKGLKATRLPSGWSITRRAMKKWVMENPDSFDLRKVKQVWFMGLMTGQ